MIDLICRNTMMRCTTPGMCSPHGGCRETEPVSSVWLKQLRSEFSAAAHERNHLLAENERLTAQFKGWQASHHANYVKTARERDQLKAEVEALRKDAAKWKSESLGGCEDVYRLSCNLAQRTGEVRELAGVVDDLCALTKRFVRRLRKAAPDDGLPEQALDYLKRKGLQGSPMRGRVDAAMTQEPRP